MLTKMEKTYQPRVIERDNLQALFDALSKSGHQLLGPTVRNNAAVLDEIGTVEELPIGVVDRQDGGVYRLEETATPTCFGCVVGPQSWKKYFHQPKVTLWTATKDGKSFAVEESAEHGGKRALIGVRPCDLAALDIHDKVLNAGPYADSYYRRMRQNVFVVAVNCTRAAGTCFCASMSTGPKATSGYDLVLTELVGNGRHIFIAEPGSKAGAKLLEQLPTQSASGDDLAMAAAALDRVTGQMGRKLETDTLKDLMYKVMEHPHWEEIAARCLTCGNCTMVCPTCFCTTVEDWTSLGGATAERVRRWDSCFTVDFSYIHGGSIRPSASARYRQWMMHKLASWVDQFGTFGCVGCGRCITWCPVGIDITQEAGVFAGSTQNAKVHA